MLRRRPIVRLALGCQRLAAATTIAVVARWSRGLVGRPVHLVHLRRCRAASWEASLGGAGCRRGRNDGPWCCRRCRRTRRIPTRGRRCRLSAKPLLTRTCCRSTSSSATLRWSSARRPTGHSAGWQSGDLLRSEQVGDALQSCRRGPARAASGLPRSSSATVSSSSTTRPPTPPRNASASPWRRAAIPKGPT